MTSRVNSYECSIGRHSTRVSEQRAGNNDKTLLRRGYADRSVTEKCEEHTRLDIFRKRNPVKHASEQHVAAAAWYNTYGWAEERCDCYASRTVRAIPSHASIISQYRHNSTAKPCAPVYIPYCYLFIAPRPILLAAHTCRRTKCTTTTTKPP